jgi:hypothetical protein
MATDNDILKDALEQWQVAETAESENREAALEDKRFAKLGEQWHKADIEARKADGRPCLTVNRMPQFLKQVINDQRMNKPSIIVRPVDDQGDPETAEIFNGLIRNIQVASNADKAYDVAFDDAVTMGFGYFRILTEYSNDASFEQDIKIKEVANAFTVYLDPEDLFNPQFGFVSEMVKRSKFKAKYGFDPKPVQGGGKGESMQGWYDGDLVRVAEYWRVDQEQRRLLLLSDGSTVYADQFNQALADQMQIKVARERDVLCPKVKQYMMTGQEFAGDPSKWAGKWIPIIPVLGEEINIEGKRYLMGLVRHAKDPARMFNYWRTASTELVALAPKAPYIGPVGAFETASAKWATANSKSHSFIEYDVVPEANGMPPQRQPFAGVPAGALQEAMNASDDMKSVMGLYDASLGARSNETSGVAITARKQEGDVSTFNFVDNLSRSLQHAGRILVDLIPNVYDTARVVRILGADEQPQIVTINKMFMGPDGKARNFDLSTGKYDVVVKTGPSFTTQREEIRTSMIEFLRAYPAAAPVLGDLLAKNMDWPDADKIAQRLQALLPPQVNGQNPEMQAAQQQMQAMHQQLVDLGTKLQQVEDDKQNELRKLLIDAYNAETNRLKVVGAGMGPEQVQALVMQTVQQLLTAPSPMPGEQQAMEPMPPMPPPDQLPVPQEPPQGGFFFA